MTTFPIELPDYAIPLQIDWEMSNKIAAITSPYTEQSTFQLHNGDLMAAKLTFDKMSLVRAQLMLSRIIKLRGAYGSFLMPMHGFNDIRGSGLGTPLVNGAVAQGAREIPTKGWDAGEDGVLLEGDWIGIGSGLNSRVYNVQEDVDANGSGLATVSVWPQVRDALTGDEAITLSSPMVVMRQKKSKTKFTLKQIKAGFSLDIREAL